MNILDNLVDYSRQAALDDEAQNGIRTKHIIIGVGGIGYWLAIQLAMMGAVQVILVDGDRIETSNLNRLPAPPRFTGKYKVNACKAQLRLLRPGLSVVCIPAHISEDTFALLGDITRANSGVIWDCTDDARIQIKISAFAQDNGMNYVKAGYDGWKVGAYRSMANTWLQDDYQPGYTTAKANAVSSAAAAALAIMYYMTDNRQDMELDLRQLTGGTA